MPLDCSRLCPILASRHLFSRFTLCWPNPEASPSMRPTPSPSLTPHAVPFFSSPSSFQAMPGPLFNFAAYLGAIIAWNAGYFPLIGTIVAWFGLFTPGVVLMFACLPFWTRFRSAEGICMGVHA